MLQSLAESNYEKDRLKDQLSEVQERNVKMEGLMNFLEEEKKRLQDKVERMTQAGEMQNCSIILKMRKKSKMNCRLDLRKILKITYICKRRWINTQYAISALL